MHITKDNLDLEIFNNVAFLQYAIAGAMGDEGSVYIYTLDGNSYYFNMLDDFSYEELREMFPGIKMAQWAIDWGKEYISTIDENGWYYYNLRYGNHLIVSGKVMNEFVEKVGRDAFLHPFALYQKWDEAAVAILNSRSD